MYDFQEAVAFSYATSMDGVITSEVEVNITPEFLTLDEIAEAFQRFLVAAGFTYVTEVTIH